MISALGSSVRITGAMVAAPSSSVSLQAAGVEDAVGEDVAAVEIGRDLDLVDREALDRDVGRHRLDRRHPVARRGRHDALLAGHQRHRLRADALRRRVVDLAREQAQRQADHAGAMRQHAVDGEVGLAGVGGAEDRLERLGRREIHYPAQMDAGLADGKAVSPWHSSRHVPPPALTGGTNTEQTRVESARIAKSGFVPYCRWGQRFRESRYGTGAVDALSRERLAGRSDALRKR